MQYEYVNIEELERVYGLKINTVSEAACGWASIGYKLQTYEGDYYLKVYDMKRSSSKRWIAKIDTYMPVVLWLDQNTGLKDRMIHCRLTSDGDYKYTNDQGVYLLFDWIDGESLWEKEYTDRQVEELADIMAILHDYGANIPVPESSYGDAFDTGFLKGLKTFVEEDFHEASDDLLEVLNPIIPSLKRGLNRVIDLKASLKRDLPEMVWCHTDVHGGNIMMAGPKMHLIDWEGLILAPREADLFAFKYQPYFHELMEHYKGHHPAFEINSLSMQFYCLRRVLEDLWEHIEILHYDDVSDELYQDNMKWMKKVIKDL